MSFDPYDDDPRFIPRRYERLVLPRWALIAVGVALLSLIIGGGFFIAGRLRRSRNAETPSPEGATQVTQATVAQPTPPGIAGFQMWRGTERVTVLVLGVDERESEFGPWRTDTMLVLSLDPLSKTGAMLSIPRDLWVDIPGAGPDRINTANVHGEVDRYPGGGPALAAETITQNLGIPIDHYVLLNFATFVTFVDALGCISLDVPEDIYDPTYPDAYYGYDPFYMSAGHHDQVCGEQALKYARTRVTFGGDFDRAARQQQVIYAVRDQLLRPGNLPALLARAPEIWATLQDGVTTDMTLEEMVALGLLAKDIPDENIRSEVLDGRYVTAATTTDEVPQSILMPKTEAINLLVREMFLPESEAPGPPLDELARLATQETATLSVRNGTTTEGLAELTAELLAEKGLDVLDVGEAGRTDYLQTVIYDNGGKSATARYLAGLLGVPESAIITTGDSQARYDVQVVLGTDAFP